MQKLSSFVENISEIDDAYKALLNHPKISEVLKTHESVINLSLLPSFVTALDEYAREYKNCIGCKGLRNCKQPINGHFPSLSPHLGRLKLSYEPCQYYLSQAYLNNIENFHMPKTVENASFDTIFPEESREEIFRIALDFVYNYDKQKFKKGIYLHGPYGTGKTFVMNAIANELAKRGIPSAMVYFPELIAQIKATFSDVDSNSENLIERMKNVDVLFLDDLGAETVTSWMRDEVLGRILNHRMIHELPTFFTSNANLDELQKTYQTTNRNEFEPVKAGRIIERIKALSVSIPLFGNNYRNSEKLDN